MKVIIVEQLHLKASLLSAHFSEITSNCYSVAGSKMAQSAPLILRLVASSITAVNRAGKIIRDVMSQGDLGIVEKVGRGVPCMLFFGTHILGSLHHVEAVLSQKPSHR